MLKRLLLGIALLIAVSLGYLYWTDPGRLTTDPVFEGLARQVEGSTLISLRDPALRMTFDESFNYLGGQAFELYGTANVEQHFFVEEHVDGTLKSFVWIQFEGFLPDNNYTYDYSASPLRLQIGEYDFFTDTAPGTSSRLFRLGSPGTDGYLARKFALDQGYSMPDEYAYARLVHIPDDERRKELLIIFIEDLSPAGLTGQSLREGGEHAARWAEIEAAHLERIQSFMRLVPID